MSNRYPGLISPQPVAIYSVEKIVPYGGIPIVVQKISGESINVPFDGDVLSSAVLDPFLAGEPYGLVVFMNNQVPSSPANELRLTGGVEPPHIIPAYKIGASAALLFEGATNVGKQYGLEIAPPINWNLRDGNYTVMAVMRPTQSHYLNQAVLGMGDEGGTILSLEGSPVIHATGSVALPTDGTITNVSPSAGIVRGMLVTSPSFYPFSDSHIESVLPTGPDTCNLVFAGGGPIEANPAAQLAFTNPIVRCYQSGGSNPGGFALSNRRYFNGEIKFEPQEFSGIELRPVVVAWTNRAVAAPNDVPGFKVWQNEIIRSAPLIGDRTDPVTHGFVGRNGGSVGEKWTQCGDFWLAALLIWDVALTQAQRTVVADSLRERFAINSVRSTRAVPSVNVMGDSIAQEYVTHGNYGWYKRLADKFPDNIRFVNYAAAGSVVTNLYPNYPPSGSNEGQFPLWVRDHLDYSKTTKNVFILFGGGNDLGAFQEHRCTFDVATNEVKVFREKITTAATAAGANVLTFADLPPTLVVGAFVDNATTPGSLPSGPSLTVVSFTANTVTLSGNVIGPGVAIGDTIRFRFHGMVVGRRLQFTILPALLTGVSVGPIYWVKAITAIDGYTIAATSGGAVIDIAGAAPNPGTLWQHSLTAAEVFGTPTTGGLQKMVANAAAAAPGVKVYMFTVLPRVGTVYDTVIAQLNALIMGGGAGGYQAIDAAGVATLANNNIPPGTVGPAYRDGVHLNEVGSQALADFFYPTLLAYINS